VIPTEVHINLVVYDADAAASGLRVASQKLLNSAERSADVETADYFYRAYYCVLALADFYERFQIVSLDSEAEAANALPGLCANWRYLLGDLEAEEFPALAMLSSDSVVGDLIEQTAQRCAQGEPVLQFLVERDEDGQWAAAADALPEPSVADDALDFVWDRAAQIAEWVKSRMKKPGARGPAVDPALPAPTA
jgi:hypothetical protein